MKNIESEIFSNIFRAFVGIIITIFIISFFIFEHFTQTLIATSTLEQSAVMSSFYTLWFVIALLCAVAIYVAYRLLRKVNNRLNEDLLGLNVYLHDISTNKNYEAILQIKHYLEFLQISVTLKNIIKRLHTKDKKK